MTTSSSSAKFPEKFDEVFELAANEIAIKEDSDQEGSFGIILSHVEIEESDDREFYFCKEFDIVELNSNTTFHIAEERGEKMYLNDDLVSIWKKLRDKSTPIVLDDLDDEVSLFTIEVESKEVSNLIEVLQKILNTNDHMGAKNISEMCQIFAEQLIQFGIKYDLVHAECIIRALVRKKSNVYEYPDWTRAGDPNDYQILSLNNALLKNPSALISMSYGYLRRLLVSAEFYERTAPSNLDPLFVRKLADFVDD